MNILKKILVIILFFQVFFIHEVQCAKASLAEIIEKAQKYYNNGNDSVLIFAQLAQQQSEKKKDLESLSIAFQLQGKYYMVKENFSQATESFLKSLSIEEQQKNKKRIAELNIELSYVYFVMEKYSKSKSYIEPALSFFLESNDSINLAKTYALLGNLENSREYCENRTQTQKNEDYKKAVAYFEKVAAIYFKMQDLKGCGNAYINLGNVYRRLGEPTISLNYLEKAQEIFVLANDSNSLMHVFRNIGWAYSCLHEHKKALAYMEDCIRYSLKQGQTQGLQFLYCDLAELYSRAGDYKKAMDNYIKYMTIRDSVYNAEKSRQIFELETKYQAEKKEQEILKLQAEKKLTQLTIYSLAIILILVIISAYYFLRASRNKRIIVEQQLEIKEQNLIKLEQDQKLFATQMILQGEETERQRLARDLHDGLGGMLSGVKLLLGNMKGNLIISENSSKNFEHALNMLDQALKELRSVAHNMMPESLYRFGLKDALSDYCHSLKEAKSINIMFQFAGQFARVDQKLEINIFRIVQELVHNAIKHSQAKDIVVQLIQDSERLCIIVQDNGLGFDIEKLQQTKGIGIASIKSRVESLNGLLDFRSAKNEGTEFTIEFKL